MEPGEFMAAGPDKRKEALVERLREKARSCLKTDDKEISKIDKINETLNDILGSDNNNKKTLFDIDDVEIIRQLYTSISNSDWDSSGKYKSIVSHYHWLITGQMIGQSNNKRTNNQTPTPETDRSFNKILYGAPGTGKSHKVKIEITAENNKGNLAAAYRTTFHPDTDYTTFVGCYKPFKPNNGGNLDYKFVPQAFLKAYVAAWKTYVAWKKSEQEVECGPKLVYLVIEEINRGNCAQAFGDIFQLLDRDEKGFSKYHITPDEDICNYLKTVLGNDYDNYKSIVSQNDTYTEDDNDGLMLLPGNLIIRATMNTSDQSLFPMDSAFKRRWDWEYVPIDYKKNKAQINFGSATAEWGEVLAAINQKIVELTHSNKKQMGEFFAGTGNITFETFRDKVLFYLFTDALKDRKSFAEEFDKDKKNKYFEDFFAKSDGGKSIILAWIKGLKDVAVTDVPKVKEGENGANPTPTGDEDKTNEGTEPAGDQVEATEEESTESMADDNAVEQNSVPQE